MSIEYCQKYYSYNHRDIALSIKKINSLYRYRVIEDMARKITRPSILIPIPNSRGDVSANLQLCNGIAKLTDSIVIEALGSKPRPSVRVARSFKDDINIEWRLLTDVPEGDIIFIDNVSCTGKSIDVASKTLGRGRGLVYAKP